MIKVPPGISSKFAGPLATVLALLAGCGGEPSNRFEHLELLPAEEQLTEFSLGRFAVPVPGVERQIDAQLPPRNRVQFEFTLHALIAPSDEDSLTTTWEHHEGKFRDRVIQVCRSTRLDELIEPELLTLKFRLLEATEPLLGRDRVRRLVISDYYTQPL